MTKQSIRDIKREATASALADAAYELALERGLDGFIVDDIVQQAGYSRRTFANYFSCKEEAVAAAALTFKSFGEAEAFLSDVTEQMTPLEIFYRLMKMQLVTEHIYKMRELSSLSQRYRSLEPYMLSAFHKLQVTAQETIEEFIHGRYPAAYSHMLAGAVYGTVMPIIDGSVTVRLPDEPADDSSDTITLEQYLDTMFGYLRKGF